MTNQDKFNCIQKCIEGGKRLVITAPNGINRHPVEDVRLKNTALQIKAKGEWTYISDRVPMLAGTDTKIW